MTGLAGALTRQVGIVLCALLAAAGIVAAVFCIGSGHGTLNTLAGLPNSHLTKGVA